jgi:hypothetical protein
LLEDFREGGPGTCRLNLRSAQRYVVGRGRQGPLYAPPGNGGRLTFSRAYSNAPFGTSTSRQGSIQMTNRAATHGVECQFERGFQGIPTGSIQLTRISGGLLKQLQQRSRNSGRYAARLLDSSCRAERAPINPFRRAPIGVVFVTLAPGQVHNHSRNCRVRIRCRVRRSSRRHHEERRRTGVELVIEHMKAKHRTELIFLSPSAKPLATFRRES